MNKILKIFLITLLVVLNTGIFTTNATFFKASQPWKVDKIDNLGVTKKDTYNVSLQNKNNLSETEKIAAGIKIKLWSDEKITQEKLINEFANYVSSDIPKSYKYIHLNIKWILKWTKIYESIQKLVYLDLLPNKNFSINKNKALSAYSVNVFAEKIFDIKLISANQVKSLKARNANNSDLEILEKIISRKYSKQIEENIDFINSWKINLRTDSKTIEKKQKIFQDVYKTLLSSHYDKTNLTEEKLFDWAIEWLAKGSWDKFTTYFPPTENKDFMESLDWKFEWIWSYVEMLEPWVLKIVTPISGSPSEKAWLKWWDEIVEVDGKKITYEISLKEAISWIKWPKKTPVVLKIKRGSKILSITVIRDTIIIKNVEYEKIDYKTFYIKLVSFWDNISWEFDEALVEMKKDKKIKKLIIDVRNNPGWYLHEVSKMLSHFVPKWKETVVVKYLNWNQNYYSSWKTFIDFSDYKIVILQNSGSASASEIMVWTIKDYFPNATIIWEQSYWKGSVQTIKPYNDGSSLKYTIAKWFTWKTQTWIDWVWIPVDIKLEFDFENFKKTKVDNQLEKAKSVR